jgi:hypothetical protein
MLSVCRQVIANSKSPLSAFWFRRFGEPEPHQTLLFIWLLVAQYKGQAVQLEAVRTDAHDFLSNLSLQLTQCFLLLLLAGAASSFSTIILDSASFFVLYARSSLFSASLDQSDRTLQLYS